MPSWAALAACSTSRRSTSETRSRVWNRRRRDQAARCLGCRQARHGGHRPRRHVGQRPHRAGCCAPLLPRLLRLLQAHRLRCCVRRWRHREGCRQARCGLIGGETAEMPGMYERQDYDLAGFAVGAVERARLLPKLNEMQEGDVLLGLRSSGLHSNGFSLARKVVGRSGAKLDGPCPWQVTEGEKGTLAEVLLTPTKIYVKALTSLLGLESDIDEAAWKALRGLSHITGGGFTDNIPRVLAPGLGARIDVSKWHGQASSSGCRARATSSQRRCAGPSTMASAWSSSSARPGRRCRPSAGQERRDRRRQDGSR
ncbi:hypothetical protein L7F22_052261 [Adiantum nelumboides]|nr:hypothetical protein [Adiantum nelumboides]